MNKPKKKAAPKKAAPVEAPKPVDPISAEREAELRLLAVNFRDVRDALAEIDRLRSRMSSSDPSAGSGLIALIASDASPRRSVAIRTTVTLVD